MLDFSWFNKFPIDKIKPFLMLNILFHSEIRKAVTLPTHLVGSKIYCFVLTNYITNFKI